MVSWSGLPGLLKDATRLDAATPVGRLAGDERVVGSEHEASSIPVPAATTVADQRHSNRIRPPTKVSRYALPNRVSPRREDDFGRGNKKTFAPLAYWTKVQRARPVWVNWTRPVQRSP